jgi:hypothetical protein
MLVPDDTQFPNESLGRWLWLAALMLMVVEGVLARRRQAAVHTEVGDVARVA